MRERRGVSGSRQRRGLGDLWSAGGLLAFLLVHRRAIPTPVLKQLRASALGYVVFIAISAQVVQT